MRLWMMAVAASLTAASAGALAHHSIDGMYDSSQQATVEGVVTQFQFIGPHPLLKIKESRTSRQWWLEMDNRGELAAIGFKANTLKPGDLIVVVGSPARQLANRMYVRALTRPADGFAYEQVGGVPQLVKKP